MNRVVWRVLVLIWTVFMLYMLMTPGSGSTPFWYLFPHADKFAHIAVFGIWGIFTGMAFFNKNIVSAFLIVVFGIIIAVSTEWYQTLIPERSGSLLDVLSDVLGVIGGTIFTFFVKKNQ